MNDWANFFVAEAGASAALAGLLFVAVSINLARILEFTHLPTRAAEALIAFLSVLAIATFALVPNQSNVAFGLEIAAVGVGAWIMNTTSLVRTWKVFKQYGSIQRVVFNQVPAVPFAIAGVLVASGNARGVYWIVPGTLLSFVAGVFGAWVLLIEINR